MQADYEMSASGGQTAKDESGWSVDTLKEHLEALLSHNDRRYEERYIGQKEAIRDALAAAEKAVAAALSAAKEAVTKAEQAGEKRFDSVNEFRSTLKDQQATFPTRSEVDQQFKAITDKVDTIQTRLDRSEGRARGYSSSWGYLVGAAGLTLTAISIVALIIRLNA